MWCARMVWRQGRSARLKPETALQKRIQVALERLGIWVIPMAVTGKRSNRSVRTGEPGLPDLCLPTLGWLEVKIGKNDLSEDQKLWHVKARDHGVWVETVYTVEDAIRLVRERQWHVALARRDEPLRPEEADEE